MLNFILRSKKNSHIHSLSSSGLFTNLNIVKNFSFRPPKETNLKGYINYIRKNSHKYASIDPLNISQTKHPEHFTASFWELSSIEKLEEFPIDSSPTFNDSLLDKNITISDLEAYMKRIYLSNVGVEFDHIENEEEKAWLYHNWEETSSTEENNLELVNAFKILYPAHLFEKFLSNKFPTFKRYSGEGANTLLVLLYSILAECSRKSSSIESAVLSMPHRGRLNVLPMILEYPVSHLLTKIQGKRDMPAEIEGIDDVVSHVAVTNQTKFCLDGSINDCKPISVSLLHNPSHLEAIYPVGMGKSYAKAKDNQSGNESVINIVIHGDAAVSGQGVIYESLSFHKAPNCDLGGTLHIVTNNQIGYTTQSDNSRSSSHCTDIFKTYSIPILHVNADDIQSLIKIGKFATNYKKKFKKDIVVNLVCWRKYGHNEVDEPMFTQPLMYKVIKNKVESVDLFKQQLLEKGLINDKSINTLTEKYNKILNDEFVKSQNLELKLEDIRNEKFKGNKSLTHKWKNMNFPQFCEKDENINTGLNNQAEIKNILKSSVTLPEDFKIHPRLNQYFVNSRLTQIEKGVIDWPSAEMAAFGSLLKEGNNLRISGQDVTRGTFSQRHIGLYDQETNKIYFPFKDEKNFDSKGRLEVNNSSLSEFAVMLFEYGYSIESPKNFVIWEAQFGDFVNGAQIAVDQFLASGEKKWMRQSALTLLLPHGFDGTERFLQLTDTNGINPLCPSESLPDHRSINICVAQPTKPSNYFHLLRRQMLRNYRKPLVVITPKIGLKHSSYVSNLSEFVSPNKFTPIVVDNYENNIDNLSNLKGVIFCSGQIFLELKKNADNLIKQGKPVSYITIRLEEIAPFPHAEILNVLANKGIKSDANIYWIQEESMNVGCYTYVNPHLRRIINELKLQTREVIYVGRDAQVGANGCVQDHKKESEILTNKISEVMSA